MNNPQNVTIALLAVLALILGAMLIGAYTTDKAYAGNVSIASRDYVAAPMSWSDSQDAVVVIDLVARKMGCYAVNPTNEKVELLGEPADLEREFNR